MHTHVRAEIATYIIAIITLLGVKGLERVVPTVRTICRAVRIAMSLGGRRPIVSRIKKGAVITHFSRIGESIATNGDDDGRGRNS